MKQHTIVCAANKMIFNVPHQEPVVLILCGVRHCDRLMRQAIDMIDPEVWKYRSISEEVQGFVNSYGTFFDRVEALEIATRMGQIKTKTHPTSELFSEDLY